MEVLRNVGQHKRLLAVVGAVALAGLVGLAKSRPVETASNLCFANWYVACLLEMAHENGGETLCAYNRHTPCNVLIEHDSQDNNLVRLAAEDVLSNPIGALRQVCTSETKDKWGHVPPDDCPNADFVIR